MERTIIHKFLKSVACPPCRKSSWSLTSLAALARSDDDLDPASSGDEWEELDADGNRRIRIRHPAPTPTLLRPGKARDKQAEDAKPDDQHSMATLE